MKYRIPKVLHSEGYFEYVNIICIFLQNNYNFYYIIPINANKTLMKLIKVEIGGYRNIDSASISFSEITTLVSVNSYGKSNLINAIDFASRFISADSRLKHQMMSDALCVPMNKETAGRDFRADFLFLTESMGTNYYADYGFSFEWIRDDGGCRITGEWLTVKEDRKGQKPNQLILREDREKILYRAQREGRCSTKINAGDDELVINRLMMQDRLYYLRLVKELNSFRVYQERHSDTAMLFSSLVSIKSENYSFDLNQPDSIPRMVYELKEKYPDRYEILTDAFCQLFPNIQSIDVRELDFWKLHDIKPASDLPFTMKHKIYSMYVNDVNLNQPLNVSVLSDGARRVFLMLTAAIIADIEGLPLIAIEEPENSIHPGLLQNYLNVLSQLAGSCRILMASHSPYIIQYVNPADIYIGRPNSAGLARFSRIKSSKIKELMNDSRQSDESVGDYIFDLLSGSADDAAILLGYLED